MKTLNWKKYYNSIVAIGHRFSEKGKIQIELEKLKWELNRKYQKLGKYVTGIKETKSVIDFSHDQEYLQRINEIIKLKYYIEERLKTRKSL